MPWVAAEVTCRIWLHPAHSRVSLPPTQWFIASLKLASAKNQRHHQAAKMVFFPSVQALSH